MLLPVEDPTAIFRVETTKAKLEMHAKHASLEASIDARLKSLENQVQDHFLKYNDNLVSLEAKMNATATQLQNIINRAYENRFISEAHNTHTQLQSCAAAIRTEHHAESLRLRSWVRKVLSDQNVRRCDTVEDGIFVPQERFMNPGTLRRPPAQTNGGGSGGSPRTYITAMKATWTTNSPQMSGSQQGEAAPASTPGSGAGPADSPRTLIPPQGTPPVRNKSQSSPPTPHLGPNHGPGSQVDREANRRILSGSNQG